MTAGPIIDVVAHPPRYMVRCSTCGIIAVELNPSEAADERDSHRCPTPSEPTPPDVQDESFEAMP